MPVVGHLSLAPSVMFGLARLDSVEQADSALTRMKLKPISALGRDDVLLRPNETTDLVRTLHCEANPVARAVRQHIAVGVKRRIDFCVGSECVVHGCHHFLYRDEHNLRQMPNHVLLALSALCIHRDEHNMLSESLYVK